MLFLCFLDNLQRLLCRLHVISLRLLLWFYCWSGLKRPSPMDHHRVSRSIAGVCGHGAKSLDHAHSMADSPKDAMLAVQPRRRRQGHKELRPIRVRTSICHRQDPRPCMAQITRKFVRKLSPKDALASSTRASGVAALYHEVLDDSVEDCAVVVASPAELGEVVAAARSMVVVQLHHEVAGAGLQQHVRIGSPALHSRVQICGALRSLSDAAPS
mmetsp:Transcript_5144/g.20534  ORF Transcript_5144/g.20534 Transcript_5144/m.20534 type:complete len:214 (+) Transcript_5144:404-1045(+)